MRKDILYHQVAALHADNIDQGFLSSLGQPFLAMVYQAIDETPGSVLIVEEREGEALGFVAGGSGMGAVYRRMLRKPIALLRALGPSLVRPARVRRIVEILGYSLRKGREPSPRPLPTAELLSIAVAPRARGQGIADSLYQRLSEHFRSSGVTEFRIVVGNALSPAHQFYRRMGAVPFGRIEVHAGEGSTIYVQTIPTNSVESRPL